MMNDEQREAIKVSLEAQGYAPYDMLYGDYSDSNFAVVVERRAIRSTLDFRIRRLRRLIWRLALLFVREIY